MKTRAFVSILILVLAVMVISEGFATEKRVTKRDYRFFSGTWINEEYNSHPYLAKFVLRPDGTWDAYNRSSDTGKNFIGYYKIVEKWIDSEDNIWYKTHIWWGSMVEGHPGNYELDKFSNSGEVWEYIQIRGDFPTEMDENHVQYHIYYRQE
jgi:hypothetical protein